jgi:hypothetical protein
VICLNCWNVLLGGKAVIGLDGHVARNLERIAHAILGAEYNSEMNSKKLGAEDGRCIEMAQNRPIAGLVLAVLKLSNSATVELFLLQFC